MEKSHRHYFFYFIFILSFVVNKPLLANDYELTLLSDLSAAKKDGDTWSHIAPIPAKDNHYYITTDAGKIFIIADNKITDLPFVNIAEQLSDSQVIKLSAIAIAPGFNLRNQFDYKAFYTAHVEKHPKNKTRITESESESYQYDAVVMRWQLGSTASKHNMIVSQREVIRIAIRTPDYPIKQLRFNPHVESWSNDFGLLFIQLAYDEALTKSSLYSGAILRINPQSRGDESYTIPPNNPFIKQMGMLNEVIFISGYPMNSFTWYEKKPNELAILYTHEDTTQLALAKYGEDWRNISPANHLWISDTPATQYSAIFYRGRELKSFWSNIILLGQQDQHWQLSPLISSTESHNGASLQKGENILHYTQTKISPHFSLHAQNSGEILLLEKNSQVLFSIKMPVIVTSQPAIKATEEIKAEPSLSPFLIILLSIGALIVVYIVTAKKNPQKKRFFLQNQWTRFDINTKENSLSLYKKGDEKVNKVINIKSITSSTVLLNDSVILTINNTPDHGYSKAIDEHMKSTFARDHRIKMTNDKERKIQVNMIDDKNTLYSFCLYYRIGNVRHTKLKYSKTLEKIIDWNWHFASLINPEASEQRVIEPKTPSLDAMSRATQNPPTQQVIKNDATKVVNKEAHSDVQPEQPISDKKEQIEPSENTEFIAALDKLVTMKKEGFLDEAEFNATKAKLLQSIVSKTHE